MTLGKKTKIIVDAETVPEEVDVIFEENSPPELYESRKAERNDKNIYIIGIFVAIAFLVLSIIIHFVWE